MRTCDNVTALARGLAICRKFLYRWRDQASGTLPEARASGKPTQRAEERERKRIAELEQLVARHQASSIIPNRGVQYASAAYVDTLLAHGILPRMSRPGNPYDNAKCELFMKTLKQEEIRCSEYRDIDELRPNLSRFFAT